MKIRQVALTVCLKKLRVAAGLSVLRRVHLPKPEVPFFLWEAETGSLQSPNRKTKRTAVILPEGDGISRDRILPEPGAPESIRERRFSVCRRGACAAVTLRATVRECEPSPPVRTILRSGMNVRPGRSSCAAHSSVLASWPCFRAGWGGEEKRGGDQLSCPKTDRPVIADERHIECIRTQ